MSKMTFQKLDTCPECQGTGRVWEELKGINHIQTTTCWRCWGLRRVWRSMTRQEVLDALGPEEPKVA